MHSYYKEYLLKKFSKNVTKCYNRVYFFNVKRERYRGRTEEETRKGERRLFACPYCVDICEVFKDLGSSTILRWLIFFFMG